MQVIEEIEEIMQDSSEAEVERRPAGVGISTMAARIRGAASGPGSETGECGESWML